MSLWKMLTISRFDPDEVPDELLLEDELPFDEACMTTMMLTLKIRSLIFDVESAAVRPTPPETDSFGCSRGCRELIPCPCVVDNRVLRSRRCVTTRWRAGSSMRIWASLSITTP